MIIVDEAIPTFEEAFVNLTKTTADLMRNAAIYTAKAVISVGFNGTIHYHLDTNSTFSFAIDTNTGVIVVLVEKQPVGEFLVTVFASDGSTPPRIGNMTLVVTIYGDWNSITPTVISIPSTTSSPMNKAVQNCGDNFILFIATIFALVVAKKL